MLEVRSRKQITLLHYTLCLTWKKYGNVRFTIYILVKKKLDPVFGMKRRDEDGLQMRKQHNQPERQDCSFVTENWGRNDHWWEDYSPNTSERGNYWAKPKYNHWEEIDYNEHQLNADVHTEYSSVHTHRNNTQNSKTDRKPFILWGCKIYACIITAALFLFVVAFNIFWTNGVWCSYFSIKNETSCPSETYKAFYSVVVVIVWPFSLWWAVGEK